MLWIKLLLQTLTPPIRVPGTECCLCFQSNLTLCAVWGAVHDALSTWGPVTYLGTWMEVLAAGFALAQIWLLWAFVE